MKKYIMILFAALSMSVAASAQNYNWGIGLRGGVSGGEITARHYLSSGTALNLYADISFSGWGWGIGGDYEFCFPLGGDGLEFYVGPGAEIGTFRDGDGTTACALSITGIAGIEYAYPQVPIAMFLDYRPHFTMSTHHAGSPTFGVGYADVALGLRFYF